MVITYCCFTPASCTVRLHRHAHTVCDCVCVSRSVMSDSLESHARLLCPWNSPGKNTGVGCHSVLWGNLPHPGIEPRTPALQVDSVPTEPPGKPCTHFGLWTSLCLRRVHFRGFQNYKKAQRRKQRSLIMPPSLNSELSASLYSSNLLSTLRDLVLMNWRLNTGSPGGSVGKESACSAREQRTWVQFLGQEDLPKKEVATHSSILSWKISWT